MLRKIDAMHAIYGTDPEGRRCKDCPFLLRSTPTERTYYKCSVYGISSGPGTDWTRRNAACGLIDKPFPEDETRILDRIKHAPRKHEEQLDGQLQMEI